MAFLFCLAGIANADETPVYYFSTFAGQTGVPGAADGQGTAAQFYRPVSLAIDREGDLFVGDSNGTIRKISADGGVTTYAGKANAADSRLAPKDGPVTDARFSRNILGMAWGNDRLWINDSNSIRQVIGNSTVITITQSVLDGPLYYFGPLPAALEFVGDICIGTNSDVIVTSAGGLRQVTWTGRATAIARTLYLVSSADWTNLGVSPPLPAPKDLAELDGAIETARCIYPLAVTCDTDGTVYFTDGVPGSLVRKLTGGTTITTIAGNIETQTVTYPLPVNPQNNGTKSQSDKFTQTVAIAGNADGSGSAARFNTPRGITLGRNGNLFIADSGNHRIRVIFKSGDVHTIGGGRSGSADGAGSAAQFNQPSGIAVDSSGNLYIADTGNHVIRKGVPVTPPIIDRGPRSQLAATGSALTLSVSASSAAPVIYQWNRNGTTISGATTATLALQSLQVADSGDYTVTISNLVGAVTSAPATLSVGAAPLINAQPVAQTVLGGQSLGLKVDVIADPAPSFQWKKDGVPIVGATNSTLNIPAIDVTDAGSYTVTITNAAGSITSNTATVTVNTSRIVNLSIRSTISSAAPLLTVGFVVSGDGKTLLVRGVGPGLNQFGLTGALGLPHIGVFAGTTQLFGNDHWGSANNAAQVSAAAAQVGAFGLPADSADAALLAPFAAGGYSAQLTGASGTSGVVLVELYDANAKTAARLVNVSARTQVGTGDNVLVAGFVIAGNAKKTLLIRAIGPTLGAFGVSGTLARPQLDVFKNGGSVPLATNAGWGGSAELAATFTAQGAFPLAAPDSKDAVLLVTLDPGSYSAQVAGVGGTVGEALVEIYDVR